MRLWLKDFQKSALIRVQAGEVSGILFTKFDIYLSYWELTKIKILFPEILIL